MPRKPGKEREATVCVVVRVSPSLNASLKAKAEELGATPSVLIRAGIRAAIAGKVRLNVEDMLP